MVTKTTKSQQKTSTTTRKRKGSSLLLLALVVIVIWQLVPKIQQSNVDLTPPQTDAHQGAEVFTTEEKKVVVISQKTSEPVSFSTAPVLNFGDLQTVARETPPEVAEISAEGSGLDGQEVAQLNFLTAMFGAVNLSPLLTQLDEASKQTLAQALMAEGASGDQDQDWVTNVASGLYALGRDEDADQLLLRYIQSAGQENGNPSLDPGQDREPSAQGQPEHAPERASAEAQLDQTEETKQDQAEEPLAIWGALPPFTPITLAFSPSAILRNIKELRLWAREQGELEVSFKVLEVYRNLDELTDSGLLEKLEERLDAPAMQALRDKKIPFICIALFQNLATGEQHWGMFFQFPFQLHSGDSISYGGGVIRLIRRATGG